MAMPATVTALAIAPVKGLRLAAADELDIGPGGAAGDRAFLVVDEENGLLLTTRTPALLQVAARWHEGTLSLGFPDGSEVAAAPELGAAARPRPGQRPPRRADAQAARRATRP